MPFIVIRGNYHQDGKTKTGELLGVVNDEKGQRRHFVRFADGKVAAERPLLETLVDAIPASSNSGSARANELDEHLEGGYR